VTTDPRTSRRFDLSGLGPYIAAMLVLGGFCGFLSTILESASLSAAFFSVPRRAAIVSALGGKVGLDGEATLSIVGVLLIAVLAGLGFMLLAIVFKASQASSLSERCSLAATRLAIAWSPATVWLVLFLSAGALAWSSVFTLVAESADLTAATCLALSGFLILPWWRLVDRAQASTPAASSSRGTDAFPNRAARITLIVGIVTYIAVFTAMNFGLWFNLRIPHGDSAMYEEHLWNLEHGKGFRSYLDQGLFLGEHIQVIHVLLVPLHLLLPSHLTLEFAQSVILALGAWPVFRLARRHSGSEWAAVLLALAYLAYYPLQYLDISIDLKTFRPSALGIPTLLAGLDALERRRYGWMTFWLAITLSAQEDFAIPIALIGLWLVLSNRLLRPIESNGRRQLIWGVSLFVFGIVYLWLALNVVIPWFRGGSTVHTASYFSKFGKTPGEIVSTLFTNPALVFLTIVNVKSILFALRLLLPIAFLPLRSPGRLLVAAPLFLLLCMNDLAMETPAPVHHFHASIIPLLFWAAAAGLGPHRKVSQSGGP
jgi:uncharacterized membrane protein